MRVTGGRARLHLAAWVREVAAGTGARVLNLTGPLGVGKSRLLDPYAPDPAVTVIDGVDTRDGAAAALRALDAGGGFLIGSRTPLRARDGWADRAMTTLELVPWSGAQIRALAAASGATGRAELDTVERLSGGVPLLADAVCRALRSGVAPTVTGALAEAAAGVLLDRLRSEARRPVTGVVPVVATLDGADDDLLRALVHPAPSTFDRLAGLSIVRPDVHGLTVAEPYRSVFDLAYRWRHPAVRSDLAARGAAIRAGQLTSTADPSLRARLADQTLYLSAHPRVRPDLYFDAVPALRVRRAGPDDADTMVELVRHWATEEGLDRQRAERMLATLLSGTDHGFHVAVDPDDRPHGMINITKLDGAAPALEPLLQQYSDAVLGDDAPGMLTGMLAAAPRHPLSRPMLVRHLLQVAVASGRLVVSTGWMPYQQMSARFGLRRLGDTREDIYRCGRHSAVYTRTFTATTLPAWVRRMQGPRAGEPDARLVALTRDALAGLRSPRRATPDGGPPPAVLRATIDALAESGDPIDAEAGRVLGLYYAHRAGGHDVVAHRMHMTRSTYFRRLEYGIRRVAEALAETYPPE